MHWKIKPSLKEIKNISVELFLSNLTNNIEDAEPLVLSINDGKSETVLEISPSNVQRKSTNDFSRICDVHYSGWAKFLLQVTSDSILFRDSRTGVDYLTNSSIKITPNYMVSVRIDRRSFFVECGSTPELLGGHFEPP